MKSGGGDDRGGHAGPEGPSQILLHDRAVSPLSKKKKTVQKFLEAGQEQQILFFFFFLFSFWKPFLVTLGHTHNVAISSPSPSSLSSPASLLLLQTCP